MKTFKTKLHKIFKIKNYIQTKYDFKFHKKIIIIKRNQKKINI